MRQQPYRPREERISQSYNDGLVTVYSTSDGAQPGYQPRIVLEAKGVLPFEERRLGVTRLYEARQVQSEIERVIRVPRTPAFDIYAQDIVQLVNGAQLYRVESAQTTTDVYPASVDLALSRITQRTEVTTP